jgi:hypothetical protein
MSIARTIKGSTKRIADPLDDGQRPKVKTSVLLVSEVQALIARPASTGSVIAVELIFSAIGANDAANFPHASAGTVLVVTSNKVVLVFGATVIDPPHGLMSVEPLIMPFGASFPLITRAVVSVEKFEFAEYTDWIWVTSSFMSEIDREVLLVPKTLYAMPRTAATPMIWARYLKRVPRISLMIVFSLEKCCALTTLLER